MLLADGADARVISAARSLAAEQGVTPVLLVDGPTLAVATVAEGKLPEGIEVVAPEELASCEPVRIAYEEAADRRGLGRVEREARRLDPLYVAAAALRAELVDACVAGATRPSAEVIRAALHVIGLAPGAVTLTSSFVMLMPDGRILSFADCAVVPEPDALQLAEIALATSATHELVTDKEATVAFLAFSTKGSAKHESLERVREALERVRARAPGLVVDGELQVDAALDQAVAVAKAPGSPVAGQADVLIFPNLHAGNIGYKLTERLAGARAVGPVLQGLAAPMHDLSRGCRAEDIETLAMLSALQVRASTRPVGAERSAGAQVALSQALGRSDGGRGRRQWG